MVVAYDKQHQPAGGVRSNLHYCTYPTMDVDGEEDSQFSAFTSSLSWWMMKSLWKEGMPDEKLRLLVADTFLLKDGHPECWYFTSSKSGRVLKV